MGNHDIVVSTVEFFFDCGFFSGRTFVSKLLLANLIKALVHVYSAKFSMRSFPLPETMCKPQNNFSFLSANCCGYIDSTAGF